MNTPSHVLEADLTRLATRLSSLERKFATLTSPAPVPAALPVDKMQLADYGSSKHAEEEDDSDEEETVLQPNVNRTDLQELVAAVRDYLEWANPQSHLTDHGWKMVVASAHTRLERALKPVENELRRTDNA